jgi:crotonobetainyl-CoA:carnitine CoA-transferase CaiB-like acyl-CoA transferase
LLGEQTEEMLAQLGYDSDEVKELRVNKVI